MATGTGSHSSVQKWSKEGNKWLPASFHNTASPKHQQILYKQQTTSDLFVAPTKKPLTLYEWWLILTCTKALPKRLETKCTWPTLDCTRAPFNQLHNQHIQKAASAGIKAPWNQLSQHSLSIVVAASHHS